MQKKNELTACSSSEQTMLNKDLHKEKRLFYKSLLTMVTYTQEAMSGGKLWDA